MPAVLVISPSKEHHLSFDGIFTNTEWSTLDAYTYGEALLSLCRDRPAIIVCDHPLRDGSWKDILSLIAPLPNPPCLIVSSRFADDHLWSEVLNLGGYDVLMQPLDKTEVLRVVRAAAREWESGRKRGQRAPKIKVAAA